MKLFLKVNAIVGFLVGFLLLIMPEQIIELLFNTILSGVGGLISAMIAGTTIVTLSIICWFVKDSKLAKKIVKALLFYNIAIITIVVYIAELYNLEGKFIWVVILFHLSMSLWSIKLIKN